MKPKNKVVLMKGLPGCGKTRYAMELVAQGYKRVNKDDLRAMIDDSKFSKDNEKLVKETQQSIALNFIAKGFNVVIDDTNFAYENDWKDYVNAMGADFEVKFIDVPVSECLRRNSLRTGKARVPDRVIWDMYNKYLKPEPVKYEFGLPNCYIFDIDGTLAIMDGRSPYDYSKVNTDKVNSDVVILYEMLHDLDREIFIVSGRESSCRQETLDWLDVKGIIHKGLFMREAGDKRDDRIVKREIYEREFKGKYNVLGVWDDRDRVVEMWRSLGLTCFQVNYGAF